MAASNNLLAKMLSSFVKSAERRTSVGHGILHQRLIALGLLQSAYSEQAFSRLVTNLIQTAEHSIGLRDVKILAELSEVLLNLPLAEANQAGAYYRALITKWESHTTRAQSLLEKIADTPAISYRARALQTLGVIHHQQGCPDEAARFYVEAMRVGGEHDLITVLSARETMSAIKSVSGDHQGCLRDLENLLPLVRHVASRHPFFFYGYHNALAVEFAELGRTAEAEAALAVALASPFAKAYPEWSETRDEIAAKRTSATPSVVAIARAPQADPTPQVQSKPEPKPLKLIVFSSPAIIQDSFQISVFPIPATATSASSAMSILDRVLICAGPRAPPTF